MKTIFNRIKRTIIMLQYTIAANREYHLAIVNYEAGKPERAFGHLERGIREKARMERRLK